MVGRGALIDVRTAAMVVLSLAQALVVRAEDHCLGKDGHHVTLSSPPTSFSNALARGPSLLVPDIVSGHVLELDIESGRRTHAHGVLGTRPGELIQPVSLFHTEDGYGVTDLRRARVVLYDAAWNFVREFPTTRPPASVCQFFGQSLWLRKRLVGNGLVSADLCDGQERVYLFSLGDGCKVTPLLWFDGPRDWREVTFVRGEGGLEELLGGSWVFVEPSRFEFSVFDSGDRMIKHFPGARECWTESDYRSRPAPQQREALVGWLEEQAYVYHPIALDASHVAVVVQSRPKEGKVKRFLEVYNVTTGVLAHREELPLPTDAGRLLVVARAEPGRLVALVRANRDPGAATEVWDFRIAWPGAAAVAGGVSTRTHDAPAGGH